MVKRKKVAAEETREQILDAAEQCFRDVGVARTTLQMIAVRAGCTRGAIYWHFTEKQDLLREIINRVPLLLFSQLERICVAAKPVAELHRCLTRNLEDIQNDRHLRNVVEIMIFRGECSEETNNAFLAGKEGDNKFLQLLVSIFDSGKARGEIKTTIPTKTLACLTFFVFTGALKSCILVPPDCWAVQEGQSVLQFVFDIAHENTKTCHRGNVG
ncbi:TetR/AcrR family transcriptional regulator [Brenneria uluponensis]|uniref:TetR/AcrR family transcriptional regulator n=1 Tax=Brenneria uluponensis TaxID=3057057 RepID=UPI0028E7CD7A|nr:TetR family transcriptional regulator [Brenneria ulupoensis]